MFYAWACNAYGIAFLKRIFNPDKEKRSYKVEEVNAAKLAGLEVIDNYE